jgi:hypothetical protein
MRQVIESVVPPDRRSPQRATQVSNQVRGWIDEMLREDLQALRKERHTARRVFDRLVDEHDAFGLVLLCREVCASSAGRVVQLPRWRGPTMRNRPSCAFNLPVDAFGHQGYRYFQPKS